MLVLQTDLYEYHGQTRAPGAAGKLTCYVPRTPEKVSVSRRRPGVLILPGGAYRWVSGREGEPVALRFAARGWAAFVLEYSCAPFGFPTSLREAAMAMGYIRDKAAEFGVDPHMVAAVGFSAGGHLCGTLGTMYDCPELADLGVDPRPDALCLCYPVAVSWGRTHEESFENISRGDPDLRRRLSLDRLVRPDMPPVFLWHTRDDQSVPCRNSLVLASALEEQGVDFEMRIHRHGQHGLSTGDEMVYPAGNVPEISRDIQNWPEYAMEFFRDKGLRIRDEEGAL
ncbi:MAG: alpha/beta hydrolase [Oscillospiraceae bacterium]|nr:alpha/beta hydrolase [Oscillospiraceae bacterium]